MKIGNLIEEIQKDLVITEAKAQKVIDSIVSKWSNVLDRDTAIKYLEWHEANSKKFELEKKQEYVDPNTQERIVYTSVNPQIAKFKIHFPNFELKFLKDATQFSGEQIKFLYDEYNYSEKFVEKNQWNVNPERNPENPDKTDKSPSKWKIDTSKKMWYSSEGAIIDEPGFRVYKVDTADLSVQFGYYLNTMYNKGSQYMQDQNVAVPPYVFEGNKWCTTNWNPGQNYYTGKRNDRSFYFVIDESKDPTLFQNNPQSEREIYDNNVTMPERYFYLGALQVFNAPDVYSITGIHNRGEPRMDWSKVVEIYPKLERHKNLLKFEKYDENKEKITDGNVINQISERSGSRYEFYKLPAIIQFTYIKGEGLDGAPAIEKPISWQHMDDATKNEYIKRTTANNYRERFGNIDLIYEIKKDRKYTKAVNYHLNIVNNDSLEKMILRYIKESKQFRVWRRSRKNNNIEILHSLTNNRYCIFDNAKIITVDNVDNAFYSKNGISYGPDYKIKVDDEFLEDDNGELYFHEIFMINDNENDPRNFHSVIKLDEKAARDQESYFFSHKQYLKLFGKYFDQEDEQPDLGDQEPEQGDTTTQTVKKDQKKDYPSLSDIFELG